MKIGLDLHGVIDENTKFFRELTTLLVNNGHEVHILSGPIQSKILTQIKELDIKFTHIFSITDYCTKNGIEVKFDEQHNPHVDAYTWDKAKGEYCQQHEIDLHFDDSDIYLYFFKTPYARILNRDTKRVRKIQI